MRITLTIGLAASLISGASLHAQRAPLVLDRPTWTAAEPFTQLSGIRILGNGQIIVADVSERRVRLLDAAGKTIRAIGRTGEGPGEFDEPTQLIALPGDTTMLVDADARRILLLDPTGRIAATVRLPAAIGSLGSFMRGTDGRGRVYLPAGQMAAKPDGPARLALLRWDRGSRVDTVAWLLAPNPPPTEVKITAELRDAIPGLEGFASRRIMPFTPTDAWVVTPAGRVGIVRAAPYHVTWIDESRATEGPVVDYPRVPVTDADRRAIEPNGPPFVRVYPVAKPPFDAGTLVADAAGVLWIRRFMPAGASIATWDSFDAAGRHAGTATIGANRRLMAFTATAVYAVRTDGDGLQWLERFPR